MFCQSVVAVPCLSQTLHCQAVVALLVLILTWSWGLLIITAFLLLIPFSTSPFWKWCTNLVGKEFSSSVVDSFCKNKGIWAVAHCFTYLERNNHQLLLCYFFLFNGQILIFQATLFLEKEKIKILHILAKTLDITCFMLLYYAYAFYLGKRESNIIDLCACYSFSYANYSN